MIELGIFTKDKEQFEQIIDLLIEYLHCPSHRRGSDIAQWRLPLINITVHRGASNARGYKYDLIYYDEGILQEELYELIYPCCVGGRPREIGWLLKILER